MTSTFLDINNNIIVTPTTTQSILTNLSPALAGTLSNPFDVIGGLGPERTSQLLPTSLHLFNEYHLKYRMLQWILSCSNIGWLFWMITIVVLQHLLIVVCLEEYVQVQ